jgi:hypothetical protein
MKMRITIQNSEVMKGNKEGGKKIYTDEGRLMEKKLFDRVG